jgi:hypothetical protein
MNEFGCGPYSVRHSGIEICLFIETTYMRAKQLSTFVRHRVGSAVAVRNATSQIQPVYQRLPSRELPRNSTYTLYHSEGVVSHTHHATRPLNKPTTFSSPSSFIPPTALTCNTPSSQRHKYHPSSQHTSPTSLATSKFASRIDSLVCSQPTPRSTHCWPACSSVASSSCRQPSPRRPSRISPT